MPLEPGSAAACSLWSRWSSRRAGTAGEAAVSAAAVAATAAAPATAAAAAAPAAPATTATTARGVPRDVSRSPPTAGEARVCVGLERKKEIWRARSEVERWLLLRTNTFEE